jgi:hypothetical protein
MSLGLLAKDVVLIMVDAAEETKGVIQTAALNSIFRFYGHQFIYDHVSLAHQLERSGFGGIRFGTYQEPTPLGKFDSHAHRFLHPPEMSQYAEAMKNNENAAHPSGAITTTLEAKM